MAEGYTAQPEELQQRSVSWSTRIWATGTVKYLFIAPAILLILGIMIFPLIYSLGISFTDWSIQNQDWTFVGVQNYQQILVEDKTWLLAMVRTVGITIVAVLLELILGFAIAHLLVDDLPGKTIIIALLIFPVVTNPIVVGFIWKVLYNPSYGPVDQIIGVALRQQIEWVWLANQQLVLPAILITEIWQWTPFMVLAILAGLLGLNPELFEAAAIDGASRWNMLTQITIPLMKPIIIMVVLIRGLDIFKLFDLVFVMTNGGPGTASQTITHYIYLLGFKFFRVGYAAAASYIMLILLSIAVLLFLRRFSRD